MSVLLRFLFSAVGLLVASVLVPGIHHQGFVDLLAVAVILGLLNATLGSLLKALAFLPMACSLGCFSLVINGAVFWLAGALSQHLGLGFRVKGFVAGFLGAIVTSVVSAVLSYFFIDSGKDRPDPPRKLKIIN